MKKHLLSLFVALLPLVASAQTKVAIGGIWYNLTAETYEAEVTRSDGDKYSGSITLTATVTYDGVAYSVTSIGEYAFEDCSSLTAITLPASVTSIGSGAFSGCRSLTAITLPEGVTSIGDWAFYYCENLTAITIPESVTNIGEYAFWKCSSLTAITLPESVTSIGWSAFEDCISLTDMYCYAAMVPSTETNAFYNSNIENATLHVPASAMDAYKNTAPWSGFGTIKAIENVVLEKCATPTISYVDGKIIFACDTEGATVKSNFIENIAGDYNDMEVALTPTYTITAYATKEHYENSDEVTLTICWVPCDENHEGGATGILTIPAKPVLIQCQGGVITLSGLDEGTEIAVYTTAGTAVATATATDGTATLTTDLTVGTIAIVKTGDYSIKVAIK